MTDELKKVGKDDPWPRTVSANIGRDPCVICGVEGRHHGVGEHFNVDHVYQRGLSPYEQFLLGEIQHWRKEADAAYVEIGRLRGVLGEISSIPGPGIVALRLMASAALSTETPNV